MLVGRLVVAVGDGEGVAEYDGSALDEGSLVLGDGEGWMVGGRPPSTGGKVGRGSSVVGSGDGSVALGWGAGSVVLGCGPGFAGSGVVGAGLVGAGLVGAGWETSGGDSLGSGVPVTPSGAESVGWVGLVALGASMTKLIPSRVLLPGLSGAAGLVVLAVSRH